MNEPLTAPFTWFGGKSRAAETIWAHFGNVINYSEPFFGSGAVLLARPRKLLYPVTQETVNDKDAYLANFWRALKLDPKATAKHADYLVSEVDILARHKWLLDNAPKMLARLKTDPDYFDPKIAGWWVWGQSTWIGDGWCSEGGKPGSAKLPKMSDNGINRKRLVRMGTEGQGAAIERYFVALSERLRNVRVVCGDWTRVLSPAVLANNKKLTGVLLDPPYTEGNQQYGAGGTGGDIANAVRLWAIANGDNRMLRIALCGIENEYVMPSSWKRVKWHAGKGMSLTKEALAARKSETIWFSPHCINNRLL